jgi:hypothetical protein
VAARQQLAALQGLLLAVSQSKMTPCRRDNARQRREQQFQVHLDRHEHFHDGSVNLNFVERTSPA